MTSKKEIYRKPKATAYGSAQSMTQAVRPPPKPPVIINSRTKN